MSVTWSTLSAASGRIEVIECYPDLEHWIKEVVLWAWEDPRTQSLDFVVSDQTGEVLATALFSPELELLVTCADGRRINVEMPESYR